MNLSPLEQQLFQFIYQRQLIWYKRFILKQAPPWTEDPILQKYKIINVYRELDRCTIYLLNVLKNIHDRKALLLNIIFYRFFNQDQLYENLTIIPFSKLDPQRTEKIITGLETRKKQGYPIFNNAYLISSGKQGQKKHVSILHNLQTLDLTKIINHIDVAQTPQQAFSILCTIPMVGPFLAGEIWTDLTYFPFLHQGWTDNDFVEIGPGAQWGLEIIYGKNKKAELNEKINHLYHIQTAILPTIHTTLHQPLPWQEITYKKAFSNIPFLSRTNIEGCLCEFRKYWNISHGRGRRKYFHPK